MFSFCHCHLFTNSCWFETLQFYTIYSVVLHYYTLLVLQTGQQTVVHIIPYLVFFCYTGVVLHSWQYYAVGIEMLFQT